MTRLLRNLSLFTLIILCASSVLAQRIDGYYVSRTESDGLIFFLLPQELFESSKSNRLQYDLTIKRSPSSDSVRMNFTYRMAEATPIDSIDIYSSSTKLRKAVERIYIEPDSKEWVHRYGAQFHMQELANFYLAEAHPTITLYSGDKRIIYNCRVNDWQRYAPIGHRIFAMIRIN